MCVCGVDTCVCVAAGFDLRYLSKEEGIPAEAENAKKTLDELIDQEIRICDQLTSYLEFWQTQMRRKHWLTRLEFMTPWSPEGINPQQLRSNAQRCAKSLLKRLKRLGGELHEHNIEAGRIDEKVAPRWSSRTWNLINSCLRPANSFGSPAAALERLTIHPGEIEHHFSRRTEEMHKEIGKAVPPFWWKWQLRKWMLFPYNTVSFPLIFITGTYVTLHYTELANTCLTSIQSVGTFLFTHIYEPIKAIIGEIFFRHAETNMDREALKMSRESLQRMLKSYFDEKFPELPEATRATMAKDMDMKAVSEEYSTLVNYALSNTLRGDIPRLALIRMQFVEKEMLGLMDSVDFLLDKNEVNMQFTATVPAVVILYFAYRVLVLLWNRLMGHKSLSILSLNMRKEMLRLDRLLNLKDRTVTNNLSPIDMGKAMVIIHRLREQLRILESQLDPHEVEAMRTDLKELLGAFGPVTVRQQLAIIRRMRLSYRTVR